MTNTRQRHIEIYAASVKILDQVGGVAVMDGLLQPHRGLKLLEMAQEVKTLTNCHISSAKRNIAKAMRRARYGIMNA